MRTSSAKEIVLGLDERLLQLRRVMTDEEDEIEDDEGEGEGKEELDLAHSAKELALLICFYSKSELLSCPYSEEYYSQTTNPCCV